MRALLGAAWLVVAHAAAAACPEPPTKACNAWFRADKVFVGKVTRKQLPAPGAAPGEIVFTVAVERSLKGNAGRVEQVRSEQSGGAWSAEVGERHVVFAYDGKVGDACSALDNPRHVAEVIRDIQRIRRTADSRVEGMVLGAGDAPVAGREVRAVAEDGRAYRDTTDASGRFVMVVPPGRYALASSGALRPRGSSRGQLDGFDVAAGECAQFSVVLD